MWIGRSARSWFSAGPAVTGVADDPEAAEVQYVLDAGEPCHTMRKRVHLASLPWLISKRRRDRQRASTPRHDHRPEEPQGRLRAHGGRGMWKVRPVVASAVGGIRPDRPRRARAPSGRSARPRCVRVGGGRAPPRSGRGGTPGTSARERATRSSSATPTWDATRASWRGCSSNSARWFVPPSTPGTLAAFHRNGGLHCASHRKSGLNEQDYDPQL